MPTTPAMLAYDVNLTRDGTVQHKNVLYYTYNEAPTSVAQVKLCADAIHGAIKDQYSAAMPADVTIGGFCQMRGTVTDWESGITDDTTEGSVEGQVHPEEVAAQIQKRTGIRGHSNRGRWFIPFVPHAFALDSALKSGAGNGVVVYKALAAVLDNQVVVTGTSITLTPCHWNRKNGTALPIIMTRVMSELVSRRDRRAPSRGYPL